MNILHLSQTDISSDSRILKEMRTLTTNLADANIYGIGVVMNRGEVKSNNIDNITISSIKLMSRKLKFLPRIVIHILSVLEIMMKMLFKALKVKPQIIHCHDTPVLPLGVILKLCTGAKIIYDAHELESNRNRLSKLAGKLTLFVEKILWRFIDTLIVVSPSIEQWYIKNIGEKNSVVILNSPVIAKDSMNGKHQYLREYFDIPTDSKIFLYVGGLIPGRGIDLIIEAFKNFDIKSSLVFLGYGELSDELKQISKEYVNIYIHDAVPHEEVVSIAKSADVGLCFIENVSLSDYYCLPNKLFEYCFSEIPVLASDFPDIIETIQKYNLGKYSALDAKSIYKVIKEFEEMNKLPRVNIENLYELSWQAQEKKLLNLYKNLIDEERAK